MATKKRGTVSIRQSAINKAEETAQEQKVKDSATTKNEQQKGGASPTKKTATKPQNTAKAKSGEVDTTIVRDSLTMPKCDYDLIESIQISLAKQGKILNKSEIIRTALHVLHGMADSRKLAATNKIVKIKVGRKKG